jgi:hypothetical protein
MSNAEAQRSIVIARRSWRDNGAIDAVAVRSRGALEATLSIDRAGGMNQVLSGTSCANGHFTQVAVFTLSNWGRAEPA